MNHRTIQFDPMPCREESSSRIWILLLQKRRTAARDRFSLGILPSTTLKPGVSSPSFKSSQRNYRESSVHSCCRVLSHFISASCWFFCQRSEPIYLPFSQSAFSPERTVKHCSPLVHKVTNNANSESRYLRCVQLLMSDDCLCQGVNVAKTHTKGDFARNSKAKLQNETGYVYTVDIKKTLGIGEKKNWRFFSSGRYSDTTRVFGRVPRSDTQVIHCSESNCVGLVCGIFQGKGGQMMEFCIHAWLRGPCCYELRLSYSNIINIIIVIFTTIVIITTITIHHILKISQLLLLLLLLFISPLGWCTLCISEASVCWHWQGNVGACIWGVRAISGHHIKTLLFITVFTVKYFFSSADQVQHMHFCIWSDWSWEILYNDGEAGARTQGNNTTGLHNCTTLVACVTAGINPSYYRLQLLRDVG